MIASIKGIKNFRDERNLYIEIEDNYVSFVFLKTIIR